MNKIFSLLLILSLIVSSMVGCAAKKAETTEPAENTAKKFRVACLLPGPINDNGWNASAYNGLKAIEKDLGVEIAYSESVKSSDFEEVFRNYANEGYDVVMGHGFEFGDAAKRVGPEFLDTDFVVISSDVFQAPNVASIDAASDERGFLAGIVSGLVTKTNIVGSVGGMEMLPIIESMDGFEKGVKYVNPSAKILRSMTGSFEDIAKAKESTLAMIEQGADVIFGSADQATLGIVEACKEKGVLVTLTGDDGHEIAPETVLASAVSEIGNALNFVVTESMNDTFEGKSYLLGAQQNVVFLAPLYDFEESLPKETVDRILQIEADLKSGKLLYADLP